MYTAVSEHWTDVPESETRCRIRVPEGADPCRVFVTTDGGLEYDGRRTLLVDYYRDAPADRDGEEPGTQTERYAAIREGRPPAL
jgi:hypothetical protein